MDMAASRSDSNIIEVLNDLAPVAVCVEGGKLFLLVYPMYDQCDKNYELNYEKQN